MPRSTSPRTTTTERPRRLVDVQPEVHRRPNLLRARDWRDTWRAQWCNSTGVVRRRARRRRPGRPARRPRRATASSSTSSGSPARPARSAELPTTRCSPARPRRARGRPAVVAPGRRDRPGPRRPVGGGGHRARRRASRCASGRRSPRPSPTRSGRAPRCCVFPTKALARDQLRAFADLGLPGLVAGAYDGDCSTEERQWVRKHANVLLTNPEMLHCALLPNHGRWATVPAAPALRRRRRAPRVPRRVRHPRRPRPAPPRAGSPRCPRRATPTFIGCSATIGDPAGLASALWGAPVEAVTDDGSPRGERLVALWRPRPVDGPTRRRRAGAADGLGPRRDGRPARRAGRQRAPGHRVLPQPAADRGRRRRRPPPPARRPAPHRAALPRRLPAGGAPRDRGGALRRRAARRRGHQRPRARRRHRRPRRLRARRLPRHDRLVLAAGRPGRPRGASRAWPCSSPATTSSTSGWCAIPTELFTPAARAGGDQPGQPVRARTPPRLRRLRAAAHPRRRAVVARAARRRRPRPRARRPPRRSAAAATAVRRRCGPAGGSPPTASGCASGSAGEYRIVRGRRLASSAPSRRHGRSEIGAPRRRVPPPGRVVAGRRPRPRRPRSPSSSPTAATSGRWPAPRSTIRTGTGRRRAARRRRSSFASAGSRSRAGSPATSGGRRRLGRGPRAAATLDLPPDPARHPGVLVRRRRGGAARRRASTRRGGRARCTPSSTPPSASCRCSRSATGGTSAACRRSLRSAERPARRS